MKNIVLIRHGESLGQSAHRNGISRKDPSLVDCFLSREGVRQAIALRSDPVLQAYKFDLICTSPLTRAIATCVLAFGDTVENEMDVEPPPPPSSNQGSRPTKFIAHSNITEVGREHKVLPENIARDIPTVKSDLTQKLAYRFPLSLGCLDRIDFSLLPESWPRPDGQRRGTRQKLTIFLQWLSQREEENIAVVCHFNIIRALLGDRSYRVDNCVPIECILVDDPNGFPRMVLKT
mmetsp:Transcript_28626/g.77521  ORF Transcript_28626/g.77521 Transcript_28626/m.77521 type:complete len:234 (+) Transcript_28626:195-896(+)